jgi:hypothetical protein
MSVNIPILDEGVPVNQLGSEFNMYQGDQRDRGLISPTIRDPEYSSSNTTASYRPDGELWNQQTLFENNYSPSELIRFTDAQSLQKLLDNSAYERGKTEVEKQLELSEDFDLDPELRGKLLQESLADGSDIFHVKSRNYVEEVQDSIKNYNKEKNLYLQKALGGQKALAGKQPPAELLESVGIEPEKTKATEFATELRKILSSPEDTLSELNREKIEAVTTGIKDLLRRLGAEP